MKDADPTTTFLQDHQAMGGFVASSYVDWNILHSPQDSIIKLLEEFRQVPFDDIMEFADAQLTDNSMNHRHVMEDVSKLFYLTEAILFEDLKYNPQILHEPWHNRYRVHPGSGRLMALWLCGYEKLKTIYTHFDEPGFVPPGDCFIINTKQELNAEVSSSNEVVFSIAELDTYLAFPTLDVDCIRTSHFDSEWDYSRIKTTKQWKFMRFSEGTEFLTYKNQWRSYVIDAWQDLQHDHIQLGTTEFSFNNRGKVIDVLRNTGAGSVITQV